MRSPEIAGIPAAAKRAAAASSSSSGRVEATISGTAPASAPAWMPSRTALHDSSTAPWMPAGWSYRTIIWSTPSSAATVAIRWLSVSASPQISAV